MIQIRYNLFETNSSSTMTFAVDICQVEGLDIPSVVRIESGGFVGNHDLNGCYAWAEWQNQLPQFFGLLKYSGVKEIYVDGKPVDADPENRYTKYIRPEAILAMCFGDYRSYSEWFGHGSESDCSQYLTPKQIKDVQTMAKNPNYIIICHDEDGNEIAWESTKFANMQISDEDLIDPKEKKKKNTNSKKEINKKTTIGDMVDFSKFNL